jgi:outer membrane protein OmpA-like peptidoglycan-associated protein
VAVALSACGGLELGKAKSVSPQGSPFNQHLYAEYISLSQMEYDEADYWDADTFALRAVASGSGKSPAPEAIAARGLPADKVGELTLARERLVTVLGTGAADRLPQLAARAQAMFDCWMQEQEENFQPADIKWCRDRFDAAMAEIGAPAPKAETKPSVTFANFTVYFDFDKSSLTAETQSTLIDAANAADGMSATSITVSGYADRSGPDAYNMKLSQRRAEAVAKELTSLIGAKAPKMTLEAFGETQNKVVTPDGVKEAKNRRVKIEIRK